MPPETPTQTTAPYWCVCRAGSVAPDTKFINEEEAREEAKRLAKLFPGSNYVVVKAIASVCFRHAQWTEFTSNG